MRAAGTPTLGSLGVIFAVSLPGSAAAQARACPRGTDPAFAGVAYVLDERARDGSFRICPDRRTPVDANADLVLAFIPPAITDTATATADQRRWLLVLDGMERLGREVAGLNAPPLDLGDSAAIAGYQAAVTDATDRVRSLLLALRGTGLTSDEAVAIINRPGDGYVNLAAWLHDRIKSSQRATADFIRSRDSVVVQVMAFRDPANGKRAQLHVQNYDELPLGELRPIDRYGMHLTAAERERLTSEMAGNQQIAKAIGRITAGADSIRGEFRATTERLVTRLEQLLQSLATPSEWASRLAEVRATLDRLDREQPGGPAIKTIRLLRSQVDSIRTDLAPLDSVMAQVRRLRATVAAPGSADFASLVAGEGGIIPLLGNIQQTLRELPGRLRLAQSHIDHTTSTVATLPAALAAQLKGALNLEGAEGAIRTFEVELPATAGALQAIVEVFGLAAGQVIPGADTLMDAGASTFHHLDDLPLATVELERAGWTLGDRVTLVVRFSERAEAGAAGAVLQETTYRLDAYLMGGHRELSSAVIFVRAVTGTADQRKWKPNVAAMVSWHHYIRDARSKAGRAWNAIDPAFGLHLANLDQSDDNVEFGLGGNLTLWHGLLSGGFGYNLSRATQGTYWFVGLNLFDVLNRGLH